MDGITRAALSRYPAELHRRLETLWYSLRCKHDRPSDQLKEFYRVADQLLKSPVKENPPLG